MERATLLCVVLLAAICALITVSAAPRCPRGSTPWPLRPTRRCGYRVGRCPGRTFCSNPRRLGICCRRGTRPPRPLPICREPHGRCRSLNECNSDRDCPRNKRCCTSRCGHKCELRRPVRIS